MTSVPYTVHSFNGDIATARCRLLSIGERQRASGRPRVDHIRGAVWEVRTSLANRIARTLFAVERRQMVLLLGFIKETQQTPNEDIKLA